MELGICLVARFGISVLEGGIEVVLGKCEVWGWLDVLGVGIHRDVQSSVKVMCLLNEARLVSFYFAE